jgi:pimeloyl-ACP methyl ester carboxylesterase
MGDLSEWEGVESILLKSLPSDWSIISVDLPGHGASQVWRSSELQSISKALNLGENDRSRVGGLSLDGMSVCVEVTLRKHRVHYIDALAGYSLGGRVALAMKQLSMLTSSNDEPRISVVNDDTEMLLISTNPGEFTGSRHQY